MISKVLDGVFFFLVFKACQYFWEKLFPGEIDILTSRIDYLEDKISMLMEEYQ